MAAIPAHIFGVSGAPRHVPDAVSGHHADRRVFDMQLILRPQECMTAMARKLMVAIAIGNMMNVMAKETAEIPNPLVESCLRGRAIRIVIRFE